MLKHRPCQGFPGGSAGKESACNDGDLGSIPGLGRSPGEGKCRPLQYSGLENSMDWIVRWVAKSQIRLSDFQASLVAQRVECLLQYRRLGFDPWVGKNPWKRKWQPPGSVNKAPVMLVFLPPWYGWGTSVGYLLLSWAHCLFQPLLQQPAWHKVSPTWLGALHLVSSRLHHTSLTFYYWGGKTIPPHPYERCLGACKLKQQRQINKRTSLLASGS